MDNYETLQQESHFQNYGSDRNRSTNLRRWSLVALGLMAVACGILAISNLQEQELPSPQSQKITASHTIVDFGGVDDGKTDNIDAFNKAVKHCAELGGCQLRIPKGKFLTSPFSLVSNMTVVFDEESFIVAPSKIKEWPEDVPSAFITVQDAENVSLIGKGTIDGQGKDWWDHHQKGTKEVDNRPHLLSFKRVIGLKIVGMTMLNSPKFHIVPRDSKDIYIEGVTILAPKDSPNTDGIDPGGCRDVHIKNVHIDNGDDNIAIKCSVQNVLVEDAYFAHGHGASIGSISHDCDVSNITFRNITFKDLEHGAPIRIKTIPGAKGKVHNITWEDITTTGGKEVICITQFYHGDKSTKDDTEIYDITIRNVHGRGSLSPGEFSCSSYNKCKDIKLENIDIKATKSKDFTCKNAHAIGKSHHVSPKSCF